MSTRILLIDDREDAYLNLKSLLEIDGRLPSLDWLPPAEGIPDSGVLRDYDIILTRKDKANKIVKTQTPQERELIEIKNRFVTMASHEFRTPLSSMNSSADLAEVYIKRGDVGNASKHINRIRKNISALNTILAEFLLLDQLDKDNIQADLRQICLPVLVRDVMAEFEALLKPGQTILYEHFGEETAWLDPALLKVSIHHLISNASKYSPPSSPILIRIWVLPQKTIISVTDHGIGIPSDDQEWLPDRFFRAQNVTNIEGKGLGLYFTKRYVELMNGVFRFSSEQGSGTTFWVEFHNMP